MTESFSFPDQTVEVIKSLKDKFGLKSNAEAISRALTLAKFLADKSGDENIVVVVGEDGPTKLNLAKWRREDQHDLVRKLVQPGERLVDKDVIMSLLGASTVQLGSIAVIMAK